MIDVTIHVEIIRKYPYMGMHTPPKKRKKTGGVCTQNRPSKSPGAQPVTNLAEDSKKAPEGIEKSPKIVEKDLKRVSGSIFYRIN